MNFWSRVSEQELLCCGYCEGQTDVVELFSDNAYLSAILDRQGLLVAAPMDLRTKKAESFSPQLFQGCWSKLKKKNPKIDVMSPTVSTKRFKQKKVVWQQYHSCLAGAEHQILGGKHFLILGPESGKIWWLKKFYNSRKSATANGPSCVASNPSGFFTISTIFCVHWSLYQPRVSEWFPRNGKSAQSLETAYREHK